jgi:uncharacterized double-CXXCG motif protein
VRYFRIANEDASAGTRPHPWVEGRHRWALPGGVGCPECGVWAGVGGAHPAVDLAAWPGEAALRDPPRVSWRQFRELADSLPLPPAVRAGLRPGTEFGPFEGTVRGGPADFAMGGVDHLLFATPGAVARLREAGVALPPAVPARLRGRGPTPTEFVEFDVPLGGRLALCGYELRRPAPCPTCGRWERRLERAVLEAGSAPDGADLLRPANQLTLLLASERFAEAARAAELTGIAFEPAAATAADT